MKNNVLSKLNNVLKNKNIDAYYISIANENLYEFVDNACNFVIDFSGFTGDTGSLFVVKNKVYLLVDGRFTVQAKKERNDDRIEIITLKRDYDLLDFLNDKLKKVKVLSFNEKLVSIKKAKLFIEFAKENNIRIINADTFFYKEFGYIKENNFKLTSAPLFLLDKKYVSETTKEKISNVLDNNEYYITSNLEEIAYITNLRYRFCDINNHNVLFKAFMIINRKKTLLYINDYLEDGAKEYLEKNCVKIKRYDDFYVDLKKYKKKKYYIDEDLNNYKIYNILKPKQGNLKSSEFTIPMSIKKNREITNLKLINILDGVAMVKSIYTIKKKVLSNKYFDINEYDVSKVVDKFRIDVGKEKYLCNSFETIVAFNSNASICHYLPKKSKSKKVVKDGLLLIDSGGNYLGGTTDITRTISTYSDKSKIPKEIIKNYTIVLNGMMRLAMQVFPDGLTGYELDILTRYEMYNEYMDYEHGTGHGIGYISNVHEGPNRISIGIKDDFLNNILAIGQQLSDEPGIYIENKYGIRIENDLLVEKSEKSKYGNFLKFDTLTLCPFETDFIDKNMLDKNVKKFINEYNKKVYDELSPYLNTHEKKWLRKNTRKI